uniref:NADH dehydrogenase subunit 2 n=1 Tax=Squamanita imbachii TaxID=2976389 RepID=UPI0030E11C0B
MIFFSILTLIICKALPQINTKITNVAISRISSIIFIFSGALSLNAFYIQSIGSGIGIYSGLFHITQICQVLEIFLLLIGSLILISFPNIYEKRNNEIKGLKSSTDYSIIVLFSTLGSCLLISTNDLISLYLSIELQSFGLYILSSLYRNSESSISAGLKYFLLGGLSSCIILLGCGLIYSYTGLTNLESLYSLITVSNISVIIQGFTLGLILIIIGLLFKIAAAPLHNWSPDVYDDTPTIVTIWLTIMPKIAIIILLLDLHYNASQIGLLNNITMNSFENILDSFIGGAKDNLLQNNLKESNLNLTNNTINIFKNLLLLSSVLSLIIGSIVGLAQTRIKRLLAYSTISHIGFMLLALAINTEQSINSLLFYLIQYTITNLNIFLILLALSYLINNNTTLITYKEIKNKININNINNRIDLTKYNHFSSDYKNLDSFIGGAKDKTNFIDIKYISELKGQFYNYPLLSLAFSISLFSMAGIPPLIGFFSKLYVLSSSMESGYTYISILAIVLSIVSASYYLKIITSLHKENDIIPITNRIITITDKNKFMEVNYKNLTNFHCLLISILTLVILLFILKPSLILNSTLILSLSLFNV